MSKVIVIINPTAGKGYAESAIPHVRTQLDKLSIDYEIRCTERPMHAASLAEEACLGGADIVAAMGGDGTVNEVLNGLMRASEQGASSTLAVLEAGRGNDFGFGTGVPNDLDDDCRLLKHGERHAIDVLKVRVDEGELRYVGNGVGIGFDTMVGFVAAKHKRLSGFPSYLVAALKTLYVYFTPPKVRITVDEECWEQRALMISLMNGQRMGGGFLMAPTAKPDDGLIDACIVASDRRHRLLLLMIDFMKGTQVGKPQVKMRQAKRIVVEALEGELPAHADGETICEAGRYIELEIIPQALKILRLPQ
ncbi:diacylglycerol kinase family lipid kinase [bacterium]|nr:diacylglycerol kinase family lipid kinase [bacterium]